MRYGFMPPDSELALTLAEQFSERPWAKLVKAVGRAIHAAVRAATASPEPPGPDLELEMISDSHAQPSRG